MMRRLRLGGWSYKDHLIQEVHDETNVDRAVAWQSPAIHCAFYHRMYIQVPSCREVGKNPNPHTDAGRG